MASRLDPELIKAIMSGEEIKNSTGVQKVYTDPRTGKVYSAVANYGQSGSGDSTATDYSSLGPWSLHEQTSSRSTNVYDPEGNFVGVQSGESDLSRLGKLAAVMGGTYLAGAGLSGLGGGAAPSAAAGAAPAAAAGDLGMAGLFDGITSAEMGLGAGEVAGAATAGATGTSVGPYLGAAKDSALVGSSGLSTVPAGVNLSNAGGVMTTGGGVLNSLKDGWDVLNAAAGTPIGRILTGVAGTALAGGVANSLSPNLDTSRLDKLFEGMLTDQQTARDRSATLWDDYMKTWQPIEHKFADTVLNYDTPGRRLQAAQEASGQVASQYDTARTVAERQAIAAGVDPSTIASLGLSSRLIEAKDRAGAENQARQDVENRGLQLLQAGSNFGRGLPSASLGMSGQAISAGSAGANVAESINQTNAAETNTRNAIFGDIINAGAKLLGLNSEPSQPRQGGNWWQNALWNNGLGLAPTPGG